MKSIFFNGEKKRLIKTVFYTVKNCMITVETIITCIAILGELTNRGIDAESLLQQFYLGDKE